MSGYQNFLVYLRFDEELVHRAIHTAVGLRAPLDIGVIQDEEISLVSICNIEIDVCVLKVFQVLFYSYKEFTVVAIEVVRLTPELIRPNFALVAVCPIESLFPPRITQC